MEDTIDPGAVGKKVAAALERELDVETDRTGMTLTVLEPFTGARSTHDLRSGDVQDDLGEFHVDLMDRLAPLVFGAVRDALPPGADPSDVEFAAKTALNSLAESVRLKVAEAVNSALPPGYWE